MMRFLRAIFWNGDEHRLRAGWRIFALFLATYAASLGSTRLSALGWLPAGWGWERTVYIALAFLALWGVVSWLDRRPLGGLGLQADGRWWRDLAYGAGASFLVVSAIFAVSWSFGWVSIRSWLPTSGHTPFWVALAVQLLLIACATAYEEALCRGYLQSNLSQGFRLPLLGARGAIAAGWLLSAVLFGLMHAGNPHATMLSMINIVLFGALLGLVVILKGSLAIPIGLHLGWNFSLGNIFGFTVSGLAPETSILGLRQGGVPLWTGGAFGPEAGLLTLLALVPLLGLAMLRGPLRLQREVSGAAAPATPLTPS